MQQLSLLVHCLCHLVVCYLFCFHFIALPVICVLISILVLVPGFGFSIDSAYGLALPTATTLVSTCTYVHIQVEPVH